MNEERPRYTIRELPASERPWERLARLGPQAISNTELLSIVLHTGNGEENALNLAQRLLVTDTRPHETSHIWGVRLRQDPQAPL